MYYDSNVKDCSGDIEAAETLYDTCQAVCDGSVEEGRYSFLIHMTSFADCSTLTVDISENGSYRII